MVFNETGFFPEKWSVYIVFGDAGHQWLQQKNTITDDQHHQKQYKHSIFQEKTQFL